MNKISSAVMKRALLFGVSIVFYALFAHTMAFAVGGVLSGSGTAADPYLVEDYSDLKAVGTTYGLGAVYRMTADIDASASATENSGRGFTPIGRSIPFFTGTLHGSGHVIRNLTINRPDSSYAGLFSYTKGLVDSLGLEGLYLRAWSYVGGIAGENDGTINQCYVTGTVTGNGGAAGGVAGTNYGYLATGTMTGCYALCPVTGANMTGGLVGSNYYGKIYNSYATGSVTGNSSVGGLVGANSSATIVKSFATGPVTGSGNSVGGLIGMNTFYYGGSVIKSYATGSVKGTASYIGGLVGYNYGWSIGTVSYCYSSGSVAGGSTVGGFFGYHSATTVVGSYWDIGSSGQTTGIGSNSGTGTPTGLTTPQMKSPSNFSSWSFDTTWAIRADSTYPGLKVLDNAPFAFSESLSTDRVFALSQLLSNDYDIENAGSGLILRLVSTSAGTTDSVSTLTFPGSVVNGSVITVKYRVGGIRTSDTLWGNIGTSYITLVTLSGSGTEGDPFLVANYTDLKTVGINSTYNLGAVYRVIADIDASASTAENSGAGFIPIGSNSTPFTGKFRGGGHGIKDIVINRPATDNVGLFGYISDLFSATSMIDSLGLVDGAITGRNSVGGITGWAGQNSIVSQCFNTGSVAGASQVGGIVGEAFDVDIDHCGNTGNIAGSSTVGGLLGSVSYSSVSYCHNTGSVSSSGYNAGGIAGNDHGSDIASCYNTGGIFAASGMAGGIAGSTLSSGTIGNCYNTGMIDSSNNIGGIVGHNGAFNTISNCYNGGGLSGTVYVGGVAGYQEFNGTIANSYWDTQVSGQGIACGDNSEGGTITAVVGLATAAMKDPASLTNLDFIGNWAMRTDSTYPGLQAMDNAPFAFRDSLISGKNVDLSRLLLNDCDRETSKANLLLHATNVSAGITDSSSTLSFPDTAVGGAIITVKYRVGENRGSDTLWGNIATALIHYDNQPPSTGNLIAPANQSVTGDSQVNFIWNSATDDHGLGYYQFQTASDSGYAVNLRDTVTNDTTLLLTLSSADTIYYWRVRAVDACGNAGEYSSTWQFEIDVNSPAVPSLLAPVDNSWLGADTAFCTWSAVAKSGKASPVYYVLKAYSLSDTINPVVVDTTALTMDTVLVSQDRYRWLVEAHDQAGNPPGISGSFYFGYDTTAPTPVILVTPINSLISNQDSTTFIWHPSSDSVSGLKEYTMQYAYGMGFSDGLAETTLTDTSITLALADSNYYWRVMARDTVGNTSLSVVRYISIDTHDPDVPALASPADNYWTEDSTVVCSWGEVVKKAKGAAVEYVIQLDTNNTFVSPIIEDTTGILLDTFNLSEGKYYWRVMAFDLAGNYGAFSSFRTFGIDTTAPDIQYVLNLPDDASAPYGPYEVTSKVYDLSGVKSGYLFTQINVGGWDSTAMFFASDSLRDSIPELTPSTDETTSVSYYLKVTDMLDHQSVSSTYSFEAIGPSGVAGKPTSVLPSDYALQNAYPNPSRGRTTFRYQLPRESKVSLTVYNVVGQIIKRFDVGAKPAGYHQISWNDNTLPNGVYIYQLKARLCQGSGGQAGEFSSTKKLMIVR